MQLNNEKEKLKNAFNHFQQEKRKEEERIEKRREFLKRSLHPQNLRLLISRVCTEKPVAFLGGIYFGWNCLVAFIVNLLGEQHLDWAFVFYFVVRFIGNFVIVERLVSIFKFELPHDNAVAKTLKGIFAFILMFMFDYIALYVPYMFYEWLHMKWLQMNF